MGIDNGFGQEISGLHDTMVPEGMSQDMTSQEMWEFSNIDSREDVYTGEALIDHEAQQKKENDKYNPSSTTINKDKEFDL